MNADEANKRIEQAVHLLGEHFGSVVVLACYPSDKDGGITQMARRGSGDWFAQQGMMREELQRTRDVNLSYEIATRAREEREKGE